MKYLLCATFLLFTTSLIADEPLVEIYQHSFDQEYFDNLKIFKNVHHADITMEEYLAENLWGMLIYDVYLKEINQRNIDPDPVFVQNRIDEEGQMSISEEQYEILKETNKIMYELVTEYRDSNTAIETFVSKVWSKRKSELIHLDIAPDQETLRSSILLLDINIDSDSDIQLIGSAPDLFAESWEEYMKPFEEQELYKEPSSNLKFYKFLSQRERFEKIIVGNLELSHEEISRGKLYIEKNSIRLFQHDSFNSKQLNDLLLEFKKENLIDRWMIEKVKQGTQFHDATIEKDFMEWQNKNLPRHRDFFGPPVIPDTK